MTVNANLLPQPSGTQRATDAANLRKAQALKQEAIALNRLNRLRGSNLGNVDNVGFSNGDEAQLGSSFAGNFTKGLPHDALGNIAQEDYDKYVAAINAAPDQLNNLFDVPLGPPQAPKANLGSANTNALQSFHLSSFPNRLELGPDAGKTTEVRAWESPRAGHVFDLQAGDAGAVGMAPAPALSSDELVAEMAEVYALALLRDVGFSSIENENDALDVFGSTVKKILNALNQLPYFSKKPTLVDNFSEKRWASRGAATGGPLTGKTAFRGSAPGAKTGPYISQFMLIGGKNDGQNSTYGQKSGQIPYGSQFINQRVCYYRETANFMQSWKLWLDAQNGANFTGLGPLAEAKKKRFICLPRDLAAYVHDDQLYQAYLNAALLLFDYDVEPDAGLPEPNKLEPDAGLSGPNTDEKPKITTRDGFATFGGPHLLALVTEVSSRALKAVRRQKYNIHRRCRPEQIGAMITRHANRETGKWSTAEADAFKHMHDELKRIGLLELVNEANSQTDAHWGRRQIPELRPKQPEWMKNGNYLLPMAFPEGSPMHPSYGAGHATVAGACVTILKAFFQLKNPDGQPLTFADVGLREALLANDTGSALIPAGPANALTLEGELNKLAANISIGRNMAGVHFHSDYFDSIRMGERLAISMLIDQMPTYGELASMSLTSYDGDELVVDTVWDAINGVFSGRLSVGGDTSPRASEDWFVRHVERTRSIGDVVAGRGSASAVSANG